MSDRCIVRPSEPGDVPKIQTIYATHVLTGLATFEEVPPSVREMSARRQKTLDLKLPYLVATVNGEVVGYCYAGPYHTRHAYRFTLEDSIYLDPAIKGRGVGSALLKELIRETTELGYRQMIAVIGDTDNESSIGLHRKFDFQHVGVLDRVGFKFGRWVNVVLMQLALGADHN
ncbi:N-acetyltransferase family protein [Amaricoccus tamworthensis]|uniref:GNAT family N-acetyltransferase n=1 Tax=Amaricoccus tamworthensis TaxID=57002 RepID=UPI003C7992E6